MFLLRVINSLVKNKVDYAIVGGFALVLQGIVRGTVDLDLVIQLTETNFIKTEKAFSDIGLLPRLPVNAKTVFNFRKEYIRDKNLIAWSFYNPKALNEIIDVIIIADLKHMKIDSINFAGQKIKVASIQDLIKMKSMTGRSQDIADVEALKELQRQLKPKGGLRNGKKNYANNDE